MANKSVLENFNLERYEENGVPKIRAWCKRATCNVVLTVQAGGGTGHLHRHIAMHVRREGGN
jgi:hypothetical protein